MSAMVEVTHLTRRFADVEAVSDLSFDLEAGRVIGFIGANGAGKTTTMRMMATLEQPDGGHVRICGFDTVHEPFEVRRRIGWMPDHFGVYANTTVHEYLDFHARAFGFRGRERRERVDEVMDFTDLTPLAERMMDKLSKGMGQRLCLGRTLLHDPDLLLLDEPAAGLDPKARVEFKRLVGLLAAEGKTLFISSHILSELEEMCSSLLFIDKGRILHQGTSESLKRLQRVGVEVKVSVLGDTGALLSWVENHPGVSLIEALPDGARLLFEEDDTAILAATLKRMSADGLNLFEFRRENRRLEDAFIHLLGENGS